MYMVPTQSNIILKVAIFFFLASSLFTPVNFVISANETQGQLEQELKDVQKQIDQYTQELAKTQTQKTTLANKIKQLQTKQKALNLQIQHTAIRLKKISGQISETEDGILKNLKKQQILRNGMAEILREMNMINTNVIIQIFSSNSFSEAYDKIHQIGRFSNGLENIMLQNRVIADNLTAKRAVLADQKSENDHLLKISTIQKQGLTETLGEQNSLLKTTKGLEKNYQVALSDRKKKAAEIRSKIYELFNTGKQIDFGQAVDIARWASGLTGVRPALLLAVLTQESNLGKNVGTCNRVGDPPEKSWKVVMKPERDQEPFKQITNELGLNIDATAVSCPMRDKKGKQVGWGGAMGPAQFIPSTWMGYKNKVTALTGKPASPWDIRDAFLASAIKLKADGANGTDEGDWKAAMRYFSGSTNLAFRFYGDNVLATAKKYQVDIDEL